MANVAVHAKQPLYVSLKVNYEFSLYWAFWCKYGHYKEKNVRGLNCETTLMVLNDKCGMERTVNKEKESGHGSMYNGQIFFSRMIFKSECNASWIKCKLHQMYQIVTSHTGNQ